MTAEWLSRGHPSLQTRIDSRAQTRQPPCYRPPQCTPIERQAIR